MFLGLLVLPSAKAACTKADAVAQIDAMLVMVQTQLDAKDPANTAQMRTNLARFLQNAKRSVALGGTLNYYIGGLDVLAFYIDLRALIWNGKIRSYSGLSIPVALQNAACSALQCIINLYYPNYVFHCPAAIDVKPIQPASGSWADSWDPTQGTFGMGYTGDSSGGTSYVFDFVTNTVAGTCTRLRIYLAAYDVTYPETFKLALYDSAGNCLGKSGDVAPGAVPGWVEAPLLNPITVTAQNYIIAHEATGGSIAFLTITSNTGAQGGNASATQFPVCPLPHYSPSGPIDAFPLGAKICVGMYVAP